MAWHAITGAMGARTIRTAATVPEPTGTSPAPTPEPTGWSKALHDDAVSHNGDGITDGTDDDDDGP
jgi:hypothetical protein